MNSGKFPSHVEPELSSKEIFCRPIKSNFTSTNYRYKQRYEFMNKEEAEEVHSGFLLVKSWTCTYLFLFVM